MSEMKLDYILDNQHFSCFSKAVPKPWLSKDKPSTNIILKKH